MKTYFIREESDDMYLLSYKQVELLKKQYPKGTEVCIDCMEGEQQMTAGLKGKVSFVDDAGQIHVDWENGSTLALVSGVDRFHKMGNPEKKKGKEWLSR